MAKQIISTIFLAVLLACAKKAEDTNTGMEFLGNWRMEAIKNPKYPYYVYDYNITKNGEGFMVKVRTTCPKCKDSLSEERNYTYAGHYEKPTNMFVIEKEGFKEILTISAGIDEIYSNKFPKYSFTKSK